MKRFVCIICAFVLILGAAPAVCAEESKRDIINSAELFPMKTNYQSLDARVEEILGQIISPEMDTYDKVKACYAYCVEDSVYYQHIKWYNVLYTIRDSYGYASIDDVWTIYGADLFLEAKHGVCNDYAAAFAVMCRALGLEAYCVFGQTNTVSGGLAGHAWVNIRIGGVFYHFDPQVEANITDRNDGVIGYYRFCATDEEMASKLFVDDRDACVAAFGGFSCEGKASVSVSDCYADGTSVPWDEKLCFTVSLEGFAEGSTVSLRYTEGESEYLAGLNSECFDVTVEGDTLCWRPYLEGTYTVFVVVSEPNGRVSTLGFVYNFYNFGEPTDVVGDIDGDGKVTPFDASLVLRYDAFLLVADAERLINGDVDRDGAVTPFDASLILRYDAMLIPSLPVENG